MLYFYITGLSVRRLLQRYTQWIFKAYIMDGVSFYEFLHDIFQQKGEIICEGFTFQAWVPGEDSTDSLRYAEADGTSRSLSRDVLISAWESSNDFGESLLANNNSSNHSFDSRVKLLSQLIKICSPLRASSPRHA